MLQLFDNPIQLISAAITLGYRNFWGHILRQRQLEAFRAIMLCQTVTRAAVMMCISQPAVTRLIGDLEESAGFQLFERVSGRLHPTAEAHLLYEEVNRSLVGVERIARTAHAIKTQQRGTLNLAATPSIALSFMPRAIAAFLKDHKEIKITLGVYDSPTIVDMVIGQRCDAGIVNLSINNAGAHGDKLLSVAHVCAVPIGHRLSRRKVVVPADIEGELFLAHPSHLGTRLLLDTMFAALGVKYKLAQVESQVSATLCSLVSAGLGIALIDGITAMEYKGTDLRFIPFEPFVPLEFSVLTPMQRTPPKLIAPFLAHVKSFAVAELGPRLLVK